MSLRKKVRRSTLTFASVALITMVALGTFIAHVSTEQISQQSVRQASSLAQAAEMAARSIVPVEAYNVGVVGPEVAAGLDARVGQFSGRMIQLRLWSADQALLYASGGDKTAFADEARLDNAALLGRIDAKTVSDIRGADTGAAAGTSSTVLDVYVPVRYDGVLVGAAQVLLDYEETADALAEAQRTVTLTVALSMAVLLAVMVFTIARQQSALHDTALDNARMALLDPLTGLPNRRMLHQKLARAIDADASNELGLGLMLLDLDHFKEVNDSLGHSAGDDLLKQVAARLKTALRSTDTVARLGGDEFAIVLPEVRGVQNAEMLAHRVRQLFAEPFLVAGIKLPVEASIGLATLPEHATDGEGLMQRADVAMYGAKAHRMGVHVYSSAEDDSSPARLQLRSDLHNALEEDDQLVLYYQPKICLRGGHVTGFEALARWKHPRRGLIAPDVFIPLAEQSGLIDALTRYVLEAAVRQAAEWHVAGHHRPIAVNLSAHNLTSPATATHIEELIARYRLPAELLQVEVTETAFVEDQSRIKPALTQIRAAGVEIAIDDFGSGTTSIAQLPGNHAQVLKIDRQFIRDLADPQRDATTVHVVASMADLAHKFSMRVVAEGVEDSATARDLAALNVDEAQGYLWSPAVPAGDVDHLPVRFDVGQLASTSATH